MENLLTLPVGRATQNRLSLHYALGEQYDSLKQYDDAFRHYSEGSRLKSIRFNQKQHETGINENLAIFNEEFMRNKPRSTHSSDKLVFVVGMPRSGTSLIEQILASHPEIYGAGELPNTIKMASEMQSFMNSLFSYPRCLKGITTEQLDTLADDYLSYVESLAPKAHRIVDKMPGNFMNLGLIEMLFPNARIIHCIRNPIDTCLSGFFQDFSAISPFKTCGFGFIDFSNRFLFGLIEAGARHAYNRGCE